MKHVNAVTSLLVLVIIALRSNLLHREHSRLLQAQSFSEIVEAPLSLFVPFTLDCVKNDFALGLEIAQILSGTI